MAGLSMKIGAYGGGVGGSNTGAQNAQAAPATASQAAWGPAYGGGSSGSKAGAGLLGALAPNDAFGIAHLAGLAATGWLVYMWWTLPH